MAGSLIIVYHYNESNLFHPSISNEKQNTQIHWWEKKVGIGQSKTALQMAKVSREVTLG